jgi:tripartite-type tricarboxylate transporter receptor subunit TctC
MTVSRRSFVALAAGAATLPAVPRIACAQAYPTRPITVIVPFAAGGGTDVAARIVGEHMARTLGQQFVVQNIAGAGGTVGSTRAMRADPDGYTIVMGQMGTHAVAVALYPGLAYRPDIDFEPIGLAAEFPLLIAARKDFPPEDLREFIPFVQANSSRLNMAHAGVGSTFFVGALLLNSILRVNPAMVPFNGGAPATNALIAGQVDYMCTDVLTSAPQLQSGLIKAYAIAAAERSPVLPELPTTREAGLAEFQVVSWFGLFAPKATPKPVIEKLTDALDQALDDANTRKRLAEIALDVPDRPRRGQAALLALVKSEIARWTPIIKAANVKID